MIIRYCYYNNNLYVVDHIVRMSKSEPFKPFVYKGICEVSMHLPEAKTTHVCTLNNPVILNKEQAVEMYPEFFI